MIDIKFMENYSRFLGASDFGDSNRKNKRFYVVYNGQTIHFGSKYGATFQDHHDTKKRWDWIKRHGNTQNKQGQVVMDMPTSPLYWSRNLLW